MSDYLQVEPLDPQSADYKLSGLNVVFEGGGDDPNFYPYNQTPEAPSKPVNQLMINDQGQLGYWTKPAPEGGQLDLSGGFKRGIGKALAQGLNNKGNTKPIPDYQWNPYHDIPAPETPNPMTRPGAPEWWSNPSYQPPNPLSAPTGAPSAPAPSQTPMVSLLRAEGGTTKSSQATPLAQALRAATGGQNAT